MAVGAEMGVRGATEQRGTHTGHFELEPVHKMFMRRMSSPGLAPGTAESPSSSPNRNSSKALSAPPPGASSRAPHTFGVEQACTTPLLSYTLQAHV